jgi:hypothetical protein
MKDEALKVALEYLEQRKLAWNVQIALKEALAAQPVQERTDYEVHLNHCNIGECEGVCKYLDDDCPALEHADMKAKWGRPTPPAQPAVPDAMTSADIQEHIEYVAGWNDCRQAMLEMMK